MVDPQLDARELRNVFGAFVTGVTIITTRSPGGRPYGLTANSFSSVSLEPPLVLWSQALTSPSYPIFRDAGRFAISILAEHQADLSTKFAKSGEDKFVGVEIIDGLGNIPLIKGAAAYLECKTVTSYPGGDHAVFLGQVERMERSQRRPLVFGGGKYMTAFPQDLGGFSLDLGIADLAHLHAVRMGAAAVSRLAAEIGTTTCLAVWGSHGPTVIRWEESARPVSTTLRTGIVLPVLRSAVGQIFGAFLPRELTRETIEAELRQFAAPTVAPFASPEDALNAMDFTNSLSAALIDQLVEVNLAGAAARARRNFTMSRADAETLLSGVRARGLARNVDLDPDDNREDKVVAFAAPVFDAQGLPVLAMAALCYARECQDGWRASAPQSLGRMARELSAQLGYTERPSAAK